MADELGYRALAARRTSARRPKAKVLPPHWRLSEATRITGEACAGISGCERAASVLCSKAAFSVAGGQRRLMTALEACCQPSPISLCPRPASVARMVSARRGVVWRSSAGTRGRIGCRRQLARWRGWPSWRRALTT